MTRLALAVFVLVASVHAVPQFDSSLHDIWHAFKVKHAKTYSASEETVRRAIFEDNVRYIKQHNLQHGLGMHTYTLGINQFADMTNEEFKAMYLRPLKKAERTSASTYMGVENVVLPDSVDWRSKGFVTGIKNQGQCGSCWAFSTTGSLEGQWFRKTGQLVSLSEQQLVDCSTKYGNQGCNGGLMDQAFSYIKDSGIETESVYPYVAQDQSCRYNATKTVAKVSGFTDVKSGSETDLQSAVATVGPISVAIDASHISFQLYKSGVYDPVLCSSTELDHGVLAVGYGTESGKDYWIVKNSWGEVWGIKGYILMARNKGNKCGIATSASYPWFSFLRHNNNNLRLTKLRIPFSSS